MNPFELHGPAYLTFYLAALVTGAVVAIVIRGMILNRGEERSVPSSAIARQLDPYEAALLLGSNDRAFAAACATLARHKIISIDRDSRSVSQLPGRDAPRMHALEFAIVSRVRAQGGTISLDALKRSVGGAISTVRQSLVRRGLVPDDPTRMAAHLIPLACYLGVALGFSIPKLTMAVNGHYPHGYLMLMTFWACAASVGFLFGASKTIKGAEVAQELSSTNAALHLTAQTNPSGLSLRDTALAYALFGSVAMVGDPFADVIYGLRLNRGGSSCGGGGCGSSCGSGCGGGGCGGCGG